LISAERVMSIVNDGRSPDCWSDAFAGVTGVCIEAEAGVAGAASGTAAGVGAETKTAAGTAAETVVIGSGAGTETDVETGVGDGPGASEGLMVDRDGIFGNGTGVSDIGRGLVVVIGFGVFWRRAGEIVGDSSYLFNGMATSILAKCCLFASALAAA
jgi:hypothetical protein